MTKIIDKSIKFSKSGIIYIAFGKDFLKEALYSAESVKKFSPGIPVAFLTDVKFDSPFVDYIRLVKINHIRSKVDYVSESPFERTIYLDSDTCIARDISDMFKVLDKYDIAAIHDFARKREKYSKIIPEYSEIPYGFSEVNGGVFAFKRNKNTDQFFNLWKEKFYENFSKTNGWDQISLRIALWQTDASIYILPIEYNVRGKDNREKVKMPHVKADLGEGHLEPRIYHMHASKNDKPGQVKGIHRGMYDIESFEELFIFCKNNHYQY